ncbi:ABC transporter ATP-binding protein [Polaromonas sp. YR568]|uniref:ABC transporter ATP-binding protein n=1 Tax=Polaromonas sp. YR568 TaxID=1855301 RepID=UPI00398BC7D1
MSLKLDHVSYRYPGTSHGLTDFTLEVQTGELLAVVGPSGSGKSTLLKLVSGLASGYSGTILLHGEDISSKPVHKRDIGVVFQSYALFPHLDVAGNVGYGLKLRGVPAAERARKAKELLELVGMGDTAAKSVDQLSGGQQQRVALARALAIGPKALLLDEPLSALDAGIRAHLRDQIRSLQRRFGATTLLVTHDQEEALTMADRVAVMKDGVLLQVGSPETIYAEPANRAVAEFIGLSNILEAKVRGQDEIDLGWAILRAPTGNRSIGATVQALIRPEHIQADPEITTINRVAGRLTARRYLGPVVRYDFSVPGKAEPILAEGLREARESIAISPDHIRLLDS